LSALLTELPGLELVSWSHSTRGLLVVFDPAAKAGVISLIASFEPEGAGPGWPTGVRPPEEEPLPPNPVWGHLAKKVLPWPVRTALSLIKSIPYFISGIFSLISGHLNVEVLDASALLVCFLRRDFKSGGTLLFFFALSHYLEMWTRQRSRAGLFRSLSGHDEKVWIRAEEGRELQIRESELAVGNLVVVRSGGLIPVDGVVVDGQAMVGQTSMTGEPLPVYRSPGGAVFAGTVVEDGELVIRATKVGGDTRVNSLVRYLEESESSKAGIQGRAERLADSIVPFNFILAGLVYLLTRDPIKAGNALLVDYSCAIRLATPLAVWSAMREGNENGLLIKGGRYLEELSAADTIVFDKTGTLTEAKPRVAEVIPFDGYSRDEALRLAACLEEHFPHPVGRAVVAQARRENLGHEEEHAEVDYVVAHGISSTWRGRKVILGSRHFVLDDEHIRLSPPAETAAEAEASSGRSILYLAVDGRLAALISIQDQLRPGVPELLADLKADGLTRQIMLTGDVETTAAALARETGFSEYQSHLLPEDKARFVEELVAGGRRVLMVGDGLNDSAALSRANVGLAMNDSSPLAQDIANVIMLGGDLGRLKTARELSRLTMRRIRGNYRIIVSMNTIFLSLALLGLAGPSAISILHNSVTAYVAWRSTRPFLPEKIK
jgi:Cu2+-exporting ATPase